MQQKHTYSSLILAVLLSLSVGGCAGKKQAPDSPWGGSIIQENGVTVINNPDRPVYGEIELRLEEDLVIGDESDEHTLFYNASRIALDAEENIYILDAGNHRIQKFDMSGNFLLSIGKEGQGPGEFDRVSGLRLDHDDHIYTLEEMRIQRFAPSGEIMQSIPLTTRLVDFSLSPHAHFYGIEVQNTDGGRRRFLHYYDPEGKQLKNIAQYDDVKAVQRNLEGGVRMTFAIRHTFNPVLILAPAPSGGLIYAFTADYSLHVIREDAGTDFIIRKEEKKRAIAQAEKDRIVERVQEQISRMNQSWPDDVIEEGLQFPVYSPFLSDLVADESGRIYTRRIKSPLDDSEREVLDIFSPGGYYLYRAVIPYSPQLIRHGHLYRIDENEETGEIKVRRYRIINWDDLGREYSVR